uniref:Uncharacterized 11.2 kDa protein in IE1-IEN intergenic region n=1 Tax=Zeugodacus cucurbitae TaxID=28588 RepID=A0A0A1WE03_ZEUCU
MRFEIYALIIFGLFYFSEGKPCPEKTRPHKTRCEAYYKCFELSSKRHVWVPEKCESGLIYEHNLGLCVLPDDDWECTLGVGTGGDKVAAKLATKADSSPSHKPIALTNKSKNTELHIINNKNEDDDETDAAISSLKEIHHDNDMEVISQSNISSEEERETFRDDIEIESSGDGVGELMEMDGFLQVENRETDEHEGGAQLNEDDENEIKPETVPKKSKIDPKLTAHLQRLSQLIDGLKTQYQKEDEEQTELRPDQLNAFLAHFNIQNKFNLIKPSFEANSKEKIDTTTTTEAPESTTQYLKYASKNKTLLQEHLDNKLKPETKVVLTNALPKRYDNTGYSNSQIVVNRPEGSVLFTLPHYGNEHSDYGHNSPKISEETLKTVLELSKQMIATQNVPKIIPNAGYYAQPLIQPLFLPASAFQTQTQGNPFAAYFGGNNNKNQQVDYEENDNKFAQFTGTYNNQLTAHKQLLRPASSYSKPGNTIIHNNVIPVHLMSTNSGEKEIVDSYGQSLGLYPPLNNGNHNSYQSHYGNTHNFVDNKFLASLTTEQPQISTTPAPSYAAQYAPSYATELGATTTRPNEYQPTAPTLTEYFSPSPHLNENNVNKLFQTNDRYPTVQYDDLPRPLSLGRPSLFAPHIDTHKIKLRPNGNKFESMEIEPDDYNDNHARPLPQLFTYNYDNDKTDQYEEPLYSSAGTSSNKHTYMPRPSAGAAATRPTYTNAANKLKPYNTHTSASFADGTQLVNMGGNFVSYDVFQNTILPLLGQTQTLNELNNVEVITCTTGVRQPNTTDCTRYYVCSKKDGKVLSYSCPPYTAFNAQSRICDAQTYAVCTPDAIIGSYTVSENKRLQLEAYKALQDAKRRQEQALKAQNLVNLLQKYGGQTQASMAVDANDEGPADDSDEKHILDSYVQQAAAMNVYSTTPKPTAAAPVKKRKYYCKEGDKIADQTSASNYFVCYKNAQGMMKGHKMACTKNLIFCSKNSMCTLASKCA